MIMETLKNNKLVTMITLVVIILLLLTGGWKLVLGAVLMGGAIYYFGEEKVKKFFVDSYKKIASLFQTAVTEPENQSVIISNVSIVPAENRFRVIVVAGQTSYLLSPQESSEIPEVLKKGRKAEVKKLLKLKKDSPQNQMLLIAGGQEFEIDAIL